MNRHRPVTAPLAAVLFAAVAPIATIAALTTLPASHALAQAPTQNFPARPLRLLAGQPPGGATDMVARIISQKLGESMGQPMVVENRVGGGGITAMETVVKSAPDGHTLMIVGTSFPKETVARNDFEEKVHYYYKRWDRSVGEDNEISEVQHEGVSSPFAVSGRLSHLEPLVHHIANWVADRIVGGDTFERRHDADKTSAIALSLTKSGGGGRRSAAAE